MQQIFICMGPGSNGEVNMAWMIVQASPIYLTDVKHHFECCINQVYMYTVCVCVMCVCVCVCVCACVHVNLFNVFVYL